MDQMTLFDFAPEEMEAAEDRKLKIVKAEFKEVVSQDWSELFDGFDELYGITFSSGIQFMEKVLDKFEYAEMIFGCEDILSSDMAAIISMLWPHYRLHLDYPMKYSLQLEEFR